MILNTFKTNLKRGLAGILCAVCALVWTAKAHAEESGTIAITFNGYENSSLPGTRVNLDCSSLSVANGTNSPSVTADGVTLTLTGYASNETDAIRYATVGGTKTSGYLFLANQAFTLALNDSRKIATITAYYGSQQPAGDNYILTTLLRGTNGTQTGYAQADKTKYPYKTPGSEVKLCTQSDQTTKYGVCLQALVIEYTGGTAKNAEVPAANDPATATFTMPEIMGVSVVSIKNGNTTLVGGETLEVGTKLTVTLKPSSADDVITEVKYNNNVVEGTTATNGNWTGTVEFADGASFAVTLDKKEITFTVPTLDNVNVTVTNGSTEVTNGGKFDVQIGTTLPVTITPKDIKKKVTKVTYNSKEADGTVAEDGSWSGSIEVAQEAIFSVATAIKTFTVTVGKHEDCTVTFVNPSDGQALTMPVDYGTVVGIAVSYYPNDKQFGSATCTDSKGNTVATGAPTTYCAATVTVTANLTVDVTLTEKTATLVSFPSVTGGTINVYTEDGTQLTNPANVATGTKLKIELVPDDGYEANTVLADGKKLDLGSDNTAEYTIPEEAKSVVITATFVKKYTITWDAAVENGSMKVEYNGTEIASGFTVRGGETITVTLTPTEGDMITTLTATGATVSATSTKNVYKVTINADTKLVAYIGKELKSYNLVLQSATGGSIKIWNNADRTGTPLFSGAATKSIQEGTPLFGTVTINNGYTFGSLKLGEDEVTVDEATGNFDFVMPARAVYLTPTYTQIKPERTVTVTVPEAQAAMGTVRYQIGEEGTLTTYTEPFKAKQGDVVTFVITASEGNRIKSVSPNLNYSENTATSKTGTLTLGTTNPTLTVNFEAIPERTLTITRINLAQLPAGVAGLTATYNGNPVVFGETTIPEGATVDFTLKADAEYEITSFKVANVAGEIASDGETATGTYTVPANTTRPSVAIDYTVKHRTTNITFRLNGTNITNLGTVVATYKDGTTTKTIQPNTDTQTQSVPTATPMSIVVTPKSGYMVKSLVINGAAIDLEDPDQVSVRNNVVTVPDCYTTPTYAAGDAGNKLEVEAEFAPIPTYYTLSITATGGKVPDKDKPLEVEYGTVTYSSTGDLSDMKKVLKDTEVSVTVAPNLNYQIKSITVNGKAQSFDILAASVTFDVTVKQNTTIAVVFEARTYRVQVSAPVNIGEQPYIGSDKSTTVESFKNGSSVTIHAPSNPGYTFQGWLSDGEYVKDSSGRLAGANYTFTMPQRDMVFTAVYTETRYTPHSVRIQVADGQQDMGTIKIVSPTSAEWTSWNDQSAFIDQWDQMVRINAVPNTTEPGRYYFDSWQVTGAASGTVTQNNTPELGELEYGGNNNVSITARFGKNYKVSVVAPVNGTIEVTTADGTTILPNNPVFVKPGTRLTLTMTADKNYNLATLVINDRETTRYNRPGTVTQTITVNEDMNLNALFYNPTGIEGVEADSEAAGEPEQWFSIQGQYLGTERPTAAGLYICRKGNKATKIAIK